MRKPFVKGLGVFVAERDEYTVSFADKHFGALTHGQRVVVKVFRKKGRFKLIQATIKVVWIEEKRDYGDESHWDVRAVVRRPMKVV